MPVDSSVMAHICIINNKELIAKIRTTQGFFDSYSLDWGNLSFDDLFGSKGTVNDLIGFIEDWLINDNMPYRSRALDIIKKLKQHNSEYLILFINEYYNK